MRQRAQERATLELGPETDREQRAKLEAEVSAERFTRIDRAMIAEGHEGVLDMRPEAGQFHANFDQTLRIGRLQTLDRYGLAAQTERGPSEDKLGANELREGFAGRRSRGS